MKTVWGDKLRFQNMLTKGIMGRKIIKYLCPRSPSEIFLSIRLKISEIRRKIDQFWYRCKVLRKFSQIWIFSRINSNNNSPLKKRSSEAESEADRLQKVGFNFSSKWNTQTPPIPNPRRSLNNSHNQIRDKVATFTQCLTVLWKIYRTHQKVEIIIRISPKNEENNKYGQ